MKSEVDLVSASLPAKHSDANKTRELLTTLQKELRVDPKKDRSIEVAVSDTSNHIYNSIGTYGIDVQEFTADSGGNSDNIASASLYKPVGESDLKASVFKLKLVYKSYTNLKSFLDTLSDYPVAISQLNLSGTTVSMVIVVYGK